MYTLLLMKRHTPKETATAYIVFIICMIALFMCIANMAHSQNVVLKNKVFVQQVSSKDSTDTGYEYQDSNLIKHKVYLSSKGKAYIYVRSKKTGKYYRRYLPKVTEMLNSMKDDVR